VQATRAHTYQDSRQYNANIPATNPSEQLRPQ
jgi:hypothetical protein